MYVVPIQLPFPLKVFTEILRGLLRDVNYEQVLSGFTVFLPGRGITVFRIMQNVNALFITISTFIGRTLPRSLDNARV